MVLAVGDMVRKTCKGPGQFVHIKCGEGLLLRRPISVSSYVACLPDDLLSIVFEVRGEGTQWLAEREEMGGGCRRALARMWLLRRPAGDGAPRSRSGGYGV